MRAARLVATLSAAVPLCFWASDALHTDDPNLAASEPLWPSSAIGVNSLHLSSLTPRPAPPPAAVPPEALTSVVQRYCQGCHSDRLQTGNLSLEGFDVERAADQAETAERMIRKLRADMMPPPGAPRPAADTLLALVETLEARIDEVANVEPGVRRFQRLSRAEYERAIRDLLDLEVDAGRWLPPDTYLGSFDNVAAAQGLSTTLVSGYLRAATEISRMAVGNPAAVSTTRMYTNPIELSQHAWDHLDGAPFGTRGGIVATHHFPADGEYVLAFETLFGLGTSFEDLDVSIDGAPVALLMLEHNGGQSAPLQTEPVFVRAGEHRVVAAFVRRIDGPYEDRFRPFRWSFVGGEDSQDWANYGITALPHVDAMAITGPRQVSGVSETASRQKVFTCRPAGPAEERPCAGTIVARLADRAFRRPVTEAEVAELLSFYDEGSAEGGFETGVRLALQAILASPEMVFRLEREPASASADGIYRLSDRDLATRLAFLLWATSPDDELLALAERGGLSDPAVFDQQVERMLADPRAEALATRFAHQWLRLQDVRKVQPEPYFYPDFTGQLAEAMVRETELFFHNLVREDRSLLELYDADYTFLNERLARHYEIDGVSGDEFRPVQYPDGRRRGILGHGSVLLLTSMSARTSPVLRGKWVMEVLMGTPPPHPPPNVPAFDATATAVEGRRLTTRERLEIHRANPTCNACHRFMDPIGLALEHYDVTGRWRIRENMVRLDTRGDFYDGTPVSTPSELTEILLKRPTPLVRAFTENLLAYAIGRPLEYYDQPVVRAIARDAEANDYRMSSFIRGVVTSEVFQTRRFQVTADDRGN